MTRKKSVKIKWAKTMSRLQEPIVEDRKKNHNNCLWITAALAAVILLGTGCHFSASPTNEDKNQVSNADSLLQKRKLLFYEKVLPDAWSNIQSGDLITRMGMDITSFLLSKINTKDTAFSHCGIALIENDTVFIYHSMGGEFNPDQKMLREPLNHFANPEHSKAIGIFRPKLTPEQYKALSNNIVEKYNAGLMFDMDFDLATDERQYCAEMVAKCLGKALNDMNWVTVSETENMRYISVENLYLNEKIIEIKRYQY
jgi:hypothetical protein